MRLVLVLAAGCTFSGYARAGDAEGSGLANEGLEASREVDPRGLSLLVQERRRSPSGLLYPYPFKPPPWASVGDLEWRGSVEAGYLGNFDREQEARFEKYVDWSDGLLLRDLVLDARSSKNGGYLQLAGGAIGRDDAFYRGEVGRRGWLRLGIFYDEVPHVLANDARSLFRGIGSERLSLPPPLTAGTSTLAAIDAALAGTGERQLEVDRERAGMTVAFRATPRLALSAHYRREHRQGERPFGGAIFFSFPFPGQNNGSVIETIEPIDFLTHDFGTGMQYSGKRTQLNLTYRGSAFENDHEELRWENPFQLPGLAVPEGRSALSPDNLSHALKGDLAVSLAGNARWTASIGWNRMTQREDLLAGTIHPGFPDWNTRSSLSRGDADALVETWLLDSSLQLRPLRPVTVRLHLRYFERDNETDYVAFNPLLGSYGYVAEDGRFGVIPRYAPVPFDHARIFGEGGFIWRTPFGANLELEYEHEEFQREQRARDTREDVGRLSLVSRRLGPATMRVAYELRSRRGSSYDPTHDRIFYSEGPPAFAPLLLSSPLTSLREFRQLDLASRRQQEIQGRLHLALGSAVDLALVGKLRTADYHSDYGLDFERSREFNIELGWQPSSALELHAFGSAENRSSQLRSINADPLADPNDPDFSAGGVHFPLANRWSTDSDGATLGAGAGFRAQITARVELTGDYSWLRARDELDYAFASDGALARNTTAALAGSGLPALRNTDQILRLGAEFEINEHWSTRLFYQLEHSGIFDPQQRGLVPRVRRVLYLAHIDESFTTSLVGAMATLKF